MTALQLEPSAHAPWTRTIFGRALTAVLPLLVQVKVTSVTSMAIRPIGELPSLAIVLCPAVAGYQQLDCIRPGPPAGGRWAALTSWMNSRRAWLTSSAWVQVI